MSGGHGRNHSGILTRKNAMLTNECHRCGNLIEFPEHGVGEEIHCPHCGVPVLLTNSSHTLPPQLPPAEAFGQLKNKDAQPTYAKGDDLQPVPAAKPVAPVEESSAGAPGRKVRRI